jgi:hypothetical protein
MLGVIADFSGCCSILCSDYAIKWINEPFIKEDEDMEEWAL